ncbi:DUF1871 family protein [Sporosarcina sp. CAU 1771]
MEMIEINKKATLLLEEWNPFEEVNKNYELEIRAIVSQLHSLDHPTDLAKKIREIYENSNKVWIPIEECVQISYKLIAIKYEAKCIV